MPKRGPKSRTLANSRPARVGAIDWSGVGPPSDLTSEAEVEFYRLVEVLRSVGSLERTDPGLVIDAARVKALLDLAHAEIDQHGLMITHPNKTKSKNPMIEVVNNLTFRRRALLKDMGLSPATSKVTNPSASNAENESPWAGVLKVS